MENHGILNWRRWTMIHKVQILAACTGVVITVGMNFVAVFLSRSSEEGGVLGWCLVILWGLILWPTYQLTERIGLPLHLLGSPYPASLLQLCAVVFTNALLFFLLGSLIGWAIKKCQRHPE